MKYFLDFILRRLVSNPDDVDVRETEGKEGKTFLLTLHPDDVGRVIGRNGRTIGAIRNLLNATSLKADSRVAVEIVENS
jgi:predicted RNA-binding protein YlqC (UPF0109 family)